MTPTKDLFFLIKSLTPPEKRYFNVYASKHVIGESNKYMQLFEAIDAQEEYDEGLIRKQFEGERFLKQLHVMKNYLYNLILDSLLVYSLNNSDRTQMRKNLFQAYLLYERGLYSQCTKVLERVKQTALENEWFKELVEAIQIEKKIIIVTAHYGSTYESLKELFKVEKEALEKMNNIREYQNLQCSLWLFIHKFGMYRSMKQDKLFKDVANHPFLKSDKYATTYTSLKLAYHVGLFYHMYVTRDRMKAYTHAKKLVTIMDKSLHTPLGDIIDYIAGVNNLAGCCIKLKKYDEAFSLIKEMIEKPERIGKKLAKDEKARMMYRHYNIYLILLIETQRLDDTIADKINKELLSSLSGLALQNRMMICYRMAYYFLSRGNFKSTIDWLYKIINESDADFGYIINYARILLIVTHIEKGNFDLLKHIATPTFKYLEKKKSIYQTEKVFIELVKGLLKKRDPDKMDPLFQKALSDFKKYASDPAEEEAHYYFDYVSWCESKVKGISFSDAIKKKNLKA